MRTVIFYLALVWTVSLQSIQAWGAPSLVAKCELNIGPGFEASSNALKGALKKTADGFTSSSLELSVKSIKTGLSSRDDHMYKELDAAKCPTIVVSNVKAKGGKGTAMMKIACVEKPISFSYKKNGANDVEIKFPILLTEFGVKKISRLGVKVENKVQIEARLPL